MGQEAEVVLFAVERGVARITLNRPDRLNASNATLSRALNAAFTEAAASTDVRVVLLTGAGRAFCAGADTAVLDRLSKSPESAGSGESSSELRYDGLMHLPKPVIAAINGPCAGVGLALAAAADIRIAATSAFFLAPFVNIGLCAENGLAWSLSRLMGRGNAAEMLLSARRMGADEAYAKGLVSLVWPDEGFAEAAFDYAAKLAQNGAPSAFAHIKAQMRAVDGQDWEEARAEASRITRETLHDADFKEATAARQQKRAAGFPAISSEFAPPIFKG